MNLTNIGWCDYSSNLVRYRDPDGNIVHACIHASEGCINCYAETLAPRWGRKGRSFTAQNMKRLTPFFDEKEAKRVIASKLISGKRMFVNDMTDWMGKWVPDEIINRCLAVFALRPDVTFQTLTKHADRQLEYFSAFSDNQTHLSHVGVWASEMAHWLIGAALCKPENDESDDGSDWLYEKLFAASWPLPHVHIGISAETQDWYDKRWKYLRQTESAVRFVSYEPALSALTAFRGKRLGDGDCPDWLILGGESGSGHREMPLKDCLKTIDDCRAAGVPIFVKQDSGPLPGKQGRIPDKYFVQEFPR